MPLACAFLPQAEVEFCTVVIDPENTSGCGHDMDFIGAVVNPSISGMPIHTLKRCIFRYAQCAVNLYRTVNGVV